MECEFPVHKEGELLLDCKLLVVSVTEKGRSFVDEKYTKPDSKTKTGTPAAMTSTRGVWSSGETLFERPVC